MIGQRFGKLQVIAKATVPGKHGRWLCKCDCGTEKVIYGGHLRAGSTVSCGCPPRPAHRTHGMAHSPEYKAWDNARDRCRNPKNRKYPLYGARGIKMCERWLAGFTNFIADIGRRPSAEHSLERKDSNADYTPDNCIWATPEQQNNNRPSYNRRLTVAGQNMTVAEASRATGIPHATILGRLDAGKSDEEAVRA